MYPLYKRYARTILDIALIVLTVFLVLFVFSTFYQIAAPIFFGVVIYFMIEPFAAFLYRRGMKKPTAALFSVLLFLIVIVSILVTIGMIFTVQIQQLSSMIAKNQHSFTQAFDENISWLQSQFNALPPDIINNLQSYTNKLVNLGTELINSFLLWLFNLVSSLPTFIFNFVMGLLLAFYLSSEIDIWRDWGKRKIPNSLKSVGAFLRENVFTGLSKYLRAQLILVSITFVIILSGLLISGVKNAFSIAILAAIFDILPVIGIPVIFVPWVIYCFLVGNVQLAISLIVIFIIAYIVRQILEPKIAGDSLGISAFTMLATIVVSLSLFGVAGVIIMPILVILIKALYDQGYFKRWIHVPADEFLPEYPKSLHSSGSTESPETKE